MINAAGWAVGTFDASPQIQVQNQQYGRNTAAIGLKSGCKQAEIRLNPEQHGKPWLLPAAKPEPNFKQPSRSSR
jgi:hypothetical protein